MNEPLKIFLQTGISEHTNWDLDWKQLDRASMTWAESKINDSDIAYINVNTLHYFLLKRRIKIMEEMLTIDSQTMAGGQKLNRLRGIKKELAELIKDITNEKI